MCCKHDDIIIDHMPSPGQSCGSFVGCAVCKSHVHFLTQHHLIFFSLCGIKHFAVNKQTHPCSIIFVYLGENSRFAQTVISLSKNRIAVGSCNGPGLFASVTTSS